jgi:heme A synthase
MILTEEQIDYIATNLEFYGIASHELHSDILDHICTHIESGNFTDFDTAYNSAIQQFGGYAAMSNLQRDTYLLVTFRNNLRRQKLLSVTGFFATAFIATGILFKFMHWPFANILFFSGFIILITAFLPLFFYQRYKNYYKKTLSQ